METHHERDVKNATMANSRFDDVNMSGMKIENAIHAGMTVDGSKVSDLFKAYETAKSAGGN